MTLKYNKAQEQCIDDWRTTLNAGWFDTDMLKEFLEAFTSIDPAADPVYNVVIYRNNSIPTKQIVLTGSKEECQDHVNNLASNQKELSKLKELLLVPGKSCRIVFDSDWDDVMEWRVEEN